MQSTYETSSHNQNVQVQYVYHCCLCLIFDQITMAQEQKYLQIRVFEKRLAGLMDKEIIFCQGNWFLNFDEKYV